MTDQPQTPQLLDAYREGYRKASGQAPDDDEQAIRDALDEAGAQTPQDARTCGEKAGREAAQQRSGGTSPQGTSAPPRAPGLRQEQDRAQDRDRDRER